MIRVENEIKIMSSLQHKNILLLYEVINDPEDVYIVLVLEYMALGPSMTYAKELNMYVQNLQDNSRPLEFPLAISYFSDLMEVPFLSFIVY